MATLVSKSGLNVGNQAPFKAAAEPLFQTGDFARRLIGRNDDLLARAVQGVERVEKLFLRGIAAGDKLNIVQHQHIDVAETVAKFHVFVVLDGGDQLVGKHFAGQVEHTHVRKMFLNEMADGVHQVRLSQTDAAVEEQRVIRHARLFGDAQTDLTSRPQTCRTSISG